MQSLSLSHAKKIALLSQGLPPKSAKNTPYNQTLSVLENLGYVQIDTISVVQRAHDHVLWSRNPSYQPVHLEQLVGDRKVFEYWSHAAAYLPMKDYRFTLIRKAAIKSGQQRYWHKKDHNMMDNILKRIESDGPLMSKDFVSESRKNKGWGTTPTKQALETLFMQGDLMIAERRGFHKVYDLTARVLPTNIDLTIPTAQDHAQFLVMKYLAAHGMGNLTEMTYQLKHVKANVALAISELNEQGIVEWVDIQGSPYVVSHDALQLSNKRLNRIQLRYCRHLIIY